MIVKHPVTIGPRDSIGPTSKTVGLDTQSNARNFGRRKIINAQRSDEIEKADLTAFWMTVLGIVVAAFLAVAV